MNALDDSAITDRCTLYGDSANFLKDERTDRCTLYEDSANFSKDERFTKNIRPQQTFERCTTRTQESPHELTRQSRQNLSKRLKARQMCIDDDDERKCDLKKTALINCTDHPIMHRTPNTN